MNFENNSTPSKDQNVTDEDTILKEIKKYAQKPEIPIIMGKTESSFDLERSYPPIESFNFSKKNLPDSLKKKAFFKDRYEILEVLGEGGMGVIQRVYDHLIGREVALKRIKLDRNNFEQLSEKQKNHLWRLFVESSITANLEHPNIIPLYDIQEEENEEFFFTMRKVEGETLRNIFQKQRDGILNYTEKELISIFLTVCDAVAYAHSKSVVHRDLKPENIMIGKFGEVYVMDWGIAKRIEEKDRKKTHLESRVEQKLTTVIYTNKQHQYKTIGGVGTEGYASPEQREDASQVTPQADIYSLGKILRECFTYLSPVEELKLQINHNPKSRKKIIFSSVEEKIPIKIQSIILHATNTRKSLRYYTVERLAKEITDYYKNKEKREEEKREEEQKALQISFQKTHQSQTHWKWFIAGILLSIIIFCIVILMNADRLTFILIR